MLRRFGGDDRPFDEAGYFTLWSCVLGPGAADDYAPLTALAERAWAELPNDARTASLLGALHYRAGRPEEAVTMLMAAESLPPSEFTSPAYGWFFRAMAEHALGHADEAAAWLKKADEAVDRLLAEADRDGQALPWNRKLTLDLLRKEAAERIKTP
jgi:tetratricopeptide (TPR) repeat protein